MKCFSGEKREISAVALVKFSAFAESEMKFRHRRSDFTRRRRISQGEAAFHPPEGWISLKKLYPGAARTYRLTSFVAPSAKTVHRTVFFRHFVPPSLFESLLRLDIIKTKKKNKSPDKNRSFHLARQEGLEPPTFWFVAKHSIRLSYWRICFCQSILSQRSKNVKCFLKNS